MASHKESRSKSSHVCAVEPAVIHDENQENRRSIERRERNPKRFKILKRVKRIIRSMHEVLHTSTNARRRVQIVVRLKIYGVKVYVDVYSPANNFNTVENTFRIHNNEDLLLFKDCIAGITVNMRDTDDSTSE